ncbi:MAG: DUF4258 domain-containing protein [Candidatus Sumerlaeota bacterium]|nr:DUF4258 domain-containing protein [Candidatus Sumerlaeota bacterium]
MDKIREKILNREYYLSAHAEEEMIADDFQRKDVEKAILQGFIERKLTHDPRGTRYRIEGCALDGRLMQVVCRFKEDGNLVIITVYAKGNYDEMRILRFGNN